MKECLYKYFLAKVACARLIYQTMFLRRYLVEFVLPGDQVLPRDDISIDSGFSDEEMEVDSEGIKFPL